MKKLFIGLSLSAFLLINLYSCSAKHKITFAKDNSGKSSGLISLDPHFVSYLNDIFRFSGYETKKIWSEEQIQSNLKKIKGIRIQSIQSPKKGDYTYSLSFADFQSINTHYPELPPLIKISRVKAKQRLELSISKQNFPVLLAFLGLDKFESLTALFPMPGLNLKEEEYLADRVWEMEEYADEDTIKKIFRSASIELEIQAPGRILRSNAQRHTGNSAFYRLGLLELLLLNDKLSFWLEY